MLAPSFFFPTLKLCPSVYLCIFCLLLFRLFLFHYSPSISSFFKLRPLKFLADKTQTYTIHDAKCLPVTQYAFLKLLHAVHDGTRGNLKDFSKPQANKQMAESKQRREILTRPRSALSQLNDTQQEVLSRTFFKYFLL
jgi:hypothetical protein